MSERIGDATHPEAEGLIGHWKDLPRRTDKLGTMLVVRPDAFDPTAIIDLLRLPPPQHCSRRGPV
jgi:hypothetical protein